MDRVTPTSIATANRMNMAMNMPPMNMNMPMAMNTTATATASANTHAQPVAAVSPYWSAFDQELIESVLFTSGVSTSGLTGSLLTPVVGFPGVPAPRVPSMPASPIESGISSAQFSQSPDSVGGLMGLDSMLVGKMSSSPLDDTMSTTSSSEGSASTRKPKRKRNYNDNTRAKHREVQRRFIVRKKEKMEQEKQMADLLEKQVQILNMQAETQTLERERSSLLQQCVASGVDLDSQDMAVFLEEEMDTLVQYYTPLQPSESSAILQQTLRYIDGFCPVEAFLDSGVNLAGWNQQSRVEHKTISFRIGKEFEDTLASQVFERTGYAMATVELFSRFFGSGLVIKTKLLQLIDLNTVILYRAIYHPVTKEISRSVELLCRVQRGDGYLIFMQSLEGLNIQQYVGTQDSWIRGVVWCQINPKKDAKDSGCSIQWTGCVGQCPVESLEHWRRDLVFLVLRYEGLVIAPLVTLTIEDAPEKPTEETKTPAEAAAKEEPTKATSTEGEQDGHSSATDESSSSA